jgi:hypothetical protein
MAGAVGGRDRRSGHEFRRSRSKGRELSLPSVVGRFAEHSRRFLGSVKAHTIFGCNVVQSPLGATLKRQSRHQGLFADTGGARSHDGVDEVDDGGAATLEELVVATLDDGYASLHLSFGGAMTGLAGAIDVE